MWLGNNILVLYFLVLLTTHYIEEAANADFVAFLRGGSILGDGRPAELLERFSCNSLENLFLKLCFEAEKLQFVHTENTNLLESENESKFDNKQNQSGDILPELLQQKTSVATLSATIQKPEKGGFQKMEFSIL